MALHSRQATGSDVALLGELNHQLIQDEGHRNPMTVLQLQERMRDWIAGEYAATLFESDGQIVAYALYREKAGLIYLRQLFVQRNQRRKGFGRQAFEMLRTQIWPTDMRLTVEVLSANAAGIAFWKAVGFREYSLALEMMPGSK